MGDGWQALADPIVRLPCPAMPDRFAACWIWLAAAVRARPGWSLAAGVLALACAAVMPLDGSIQPILRAWAGAPGFPSILDLVRPFGRGEVVVLLALACAAAGRRRLAGQILAALVISAAITWAIKVGIGRVRPNEGDFSFVSGDTSCAAAIVPVLARGWLSSLVLAGIALAVALSRIVLGYHWPSDVLGGLAVGLISGVLGLRAWPDRPWRWLSMRRFWDWAALVATLGMVGWSLADPRLGWLRATVCVWLPALGAWVAWSRLRPRLRGGLHLPSWAGWAVAGGLLVALGWLSVSHSLLDRDEPRNALAAREMIASGDWMVPTFNGELRLHKPILPYWLMTAALRTGLPVDIACRLPAVLCMALAVLLTMVMARRLAGSAGGDPRVVPAVAGLAMAVSPLVIVSGSAATTDAALLLGIAASLAILVDAALRGWRGWHLVLIGPAMAWAILAKGPMGLLVPIAAIGGGMAVSWLARRREAALAPVGWGGAWLVLVVGLVVSTLLSLAWFLPANAATNGLLYRVMIGEHVVERGLSVRESHGGGPLYYLPVLLIAFVAWLPALAAGLRRAPVLITTRPGAMMVAWAGTVFAAITVFQTKLPHYLLPMVPPTAVIAAWAVCDPIPADRAWWRWGWRIQAVLLAVLAVVLVLVPLALSVYSVGGWPMHDLPLASLAAPALGVGLALAVLLLICRAAARRADRSAFAVAAAIGMAGLVATLALNVGQLEGFKPAPRVAEAVRSAAAVGVPVAVCDYEEPSLLFYIGPERGPVEVLRSAKDLQTWALRPGPGICVTSVTRLAEAEARQGGALPLDRVQRTTGYNYSNGKRLDVLVMVRHPVVP